MTETSAVAAATVITLRPAEGGFELLLIERHAATAFAGGAMVFPGGRVEPDDAAIAADTALADGFDALDSVDAAARVAAARELFEEADILLSDGPPLPPGVRADWSTRLNAGSARYADLLAAHGHRLDAARLLPFAHWVPPAAAPIARRFDTRFYLARLPAGETAVADGHEAVATRWITAAEAVAQAAAGAIDLVFPTRRVLERIAQYRTLDPLVQAARTAPVIRIQPRIEMRDGTAWITIPEGCDYPVTEAPVAAVRRG